MLVGARVLGYGGGVDAALMRERRFANIGRVPVGLAVQKLVELAGKRGQRGERFRGDAGFEAARIVLLQDQGWDDRGEVRVAAALAEPVQRALDLPGARADGRQRVGDRVLRIVMGVDADALAGDVADDGGDDLLDLVRQRAAVRVAKTTQRAPAS